MGMDIWEVIAKFMAKGPGRTEKERTDAKRELFMILNETTKAEPLDLQGWLSTEPEQQIMQLIKQVHPWDNKNQENPTSAPLDNTDWVVPKIEHGDSIETFKVKARIFITNLESNLSQDNVNYDKNLTAAMQSFLQRDQSWMTEMQGKATTARPGQAILRNNSTRKASPDEIEQWLILIWHEHLKKIAQQEEARNIEFDRRTRVQPSDSKQQVQRKVYQALRQAEPIKGGIINNGGMDSGNSAQAIFCLENLFSVDQSWMPQLRAIAASATRNPNALQHGHYEQISYRDIQEWVDTLWTNRSGTSILRKMSNFLSRFQEDPPADVSEQFQEALNMVSDIAGKVEILLPVRTRNSEHAELALADLTPLLTNLRLAANWSGQSTEFWDIIEANNHGLALFQNDEALIANDGYGGTRQQIKDTAKAIQEIAKEQQRLNQRQNPSHSQSRIKEVKNQVHQLTSQHEEMAIRLTTQQAIHLIRRNQNTLQEDKSRGWCGRKHCEQRSICFNNRLQRQLQDGYLYILQRCPLTDNTNCDIVQRSTETLARLGQQIRIYDRDQNREVDITINPQGSIQEEGQKGGNEGKSTSVTIIGTYTSDGLTNPIFTTNRWEPTISNNPQTAQPKDVKRQNARRRKRNKANGFIVGRITAETQPPQEDDHATQKQEPKALKHWLKSLEQEPWWPQDQDKPASEIEQQPTETGATISVLRFTNKKNRHKRKKVTKSKKHTHTQTHTHTHKQTG